MVKVSNGGCIRHLSRKALLASRKRNIIAVIAIALTALLFTSLFTVVLSINETNQNYQFRYVGSCAHGSFKNVDNEQTAKLAAHPKISKSGVRTVIGLCLDGAFEKDYGEVSYMSENCAKWSFSEPVVGRMPKTGNEIAMDSTALALLGAEPEIGAKVTLTYTLTDKNQLGGSITDDFTLVGWWDYDELLDVHFLNVSKDYVNQIEAQAIAEGMQPFRTDMSVMLKFPLDIEEALTEIGEDCGYCVGEKSGQLRIGVNWGYTSTQILNTLDTGGIIAIIALLIIVTFTGYLVIYSIFRISVAGDIRFYGLLKTIGVTPRQLRRIIRQQALMLCVIGIPAGLLLGWGAGALAVPVTLSASSFGDRYTTVSLSPWIFAVAAAFALLTVLLSCARPGRIAGNVSPVEAVRYTEAAQKRGKARRSRRVTPFSMALANLGRSKGKTELVIVSLSLAVVMLNILVTFLNGFDMDKYLSSRSCADFIVSTQDYFNYRGFTLTEEDLSSVLTNTERSLGGFAFGTGTVKMYMPEEALRNEASYYLGEDEVDEYLNVVLRDGEKLAADSQIEGIEPELMTKLNVIDGDISPLGAEDSRAIAIDVSLDDFGLLPNPEDYPAVGDSVKVTYLSDGTQRDAMYTVCALVELPYNMSSRFNTIGYSAVISADALRRDAGAENTIPMLYLFDAPTDAAEASAEEYLSALCSSPSSPLMYESKATQREHFREFRMTFAVLGGLLCAVIAVVGILNFFNAMMTSILSRRREFAVLESVGQTHGQLKSMLVWEGLLYSLGSGIISLVISAAVNPLSGKLLENVYWFYSYRYTVAPVLLSIPVFAVLGCAIPTVMYCASSRYSIVERLREI